MYYNPSMGAELNRREVLELAKDGAMFGAMVGIVDVSADDVPRKTNVLKTMAHLGLYSLFGAGAMIAGGNTLAEIRKREQGKAKIDTNQQEATSISKP